MKVVSEEFERVGVAKLDTKKRVTLGGIFKKLKKGNIFKDVSIDGFEAFMGTEGDILLRPQASMPARELWVHQNPQIMESLQHGVKDIEEGRTTKVDDVDEFLTDL